MRGRAFGSLSSAGLLAAAVVALLAAPSPAAAASIQTIAAGASATNLPTANVWPGAQNPPYICCWTKQGQYVTFTFTVPSTGATSLTLRYSAGNGTAHRKLELDGAVWVAKQTFSKTHNWSTWTTVSLSRTLGAGTHALKVWFDSAAGSTNGIDLDNLTVSQSGGGGTPVPVNTALPTISGVAQAGQALTASAGTWANSPTTYAYQWQRCGNSCASISGAIASGYTLAAADVGSTIEVSVTASNSGGASTPATSAPTGVVAAAASSAQTIAAGTSATNLPTENVWPGAQNPPYICCWSQQGQYVTFSFSIPATGSVNLALRYSAGNGIAHRKLELDGAVWVATQPFTATANWSTWTALPLSTNLSTGTHTLKVWFDSTAGSDNYINLDNLTISTGPAPPVAQTTVAVGYVDGATGLSPWSGSSNTFFIGEGPQCCLTHGPDNGALGYDAGAIEITNSGTSPLTLNAVTTDFGGGSSPSHFDLWGGGTSTTLPQTVAPGAHVVLTMTSGFNFDPSDLFGEACNVNSGVVPVVHVTVNGVTTDYHDNHQILNSDGSDLASCPGDISERMPFTDLVPNDQPAAAPVDDVAPSLAGVPAQSRILSGFAGAWNASPPPSLSLQWNRCDGAGANCAPITGANSATYIPVSTDVGSTLTLAVTATNPSGAVVRSSAATSVIQAGPSVAQLGDTSTGFTSVFFTSSSVEQGSIFTAAQSGTTTDFEFYARGGAADQVFTPKIYSVVNGQKGSLLATGPSVTVPKGADGDWYVSTLSGLKLTATTQYYLALNPTPVFNGTYVGAETNGQLAAFVDYTQP